MLNQVIARCVQTIALILVFGGTAAAAEPIVWQLDSLSEVGGHPVTILGSPRVVREGGKAAVCFDGKSDAMFVAVNPIAGWERFTVEALIKPDADGEEEQRFFHIQDDRDSRLLLETRLTPDAKWALDTFLFVRDDIRLPLLDRSLLHPAGQWQWVTLTFDGETMTHYVNGKKELEGKIAFEPMTAGRTSIGVRQNKVSWYKGCIRELRFTRGSAPRRAPTRDEVMESE